MHAWKNRINCPAGHSSMMICSDGMVIPCEQMPEVEEYFCGDLRKQTILEVWNGERLRDLTHGVDKEKFSGTACYDCEDWEECYRLKGCCIRDLSLFSNTIYQPPFNCYKSTLPFIRQS